MQNKSAQLLQGFTLLELLVVISLMAIITGITIPNFNGYVRNQNLRQAQISIVADARKMQSRALNGVQYDIVTPATTAWVVKYPSAENQPIYSLSRADLSTIADLRDECSDIADGEKGAVFPAGIVIQNSYDVCVYFDFSSGNAITVVPDGESDTNIYVSYPGENTNCRSININPAGLIQERGETTCTT